MWSDVRGCRRVGADAARPRRDDGRCLIVLDHGGSRRRVIIGHNRPVAPAPEGAPGGSGRPRGPAGRVPPPGLGPVPCRGGGPGGVPHAGGDARARRRPRPRRLGGLGLEEGRPCPASPLLENPPAPTTGAPCTHSRRPSPPPSFTPRLQNHPLNNFHNTPRSH